MKNKTRFHKKTATEVEPKVEPKVEKQSAKKIPNDTKPVEFMDIPGELRNKIYRLAIPTGKFMTSVKPNPQGQRAPQDVLAATCKKIRQEVLSIYYGENVFELAHDGIDIGPHAVMVRPLDFAITERRVAAETAHIAVRAKFLIRFRSDGTIHITVQQLPHPRHGWRCGCVKHVLVSAPAPTTLEWHHFWHIVRTLKKIQKPVKEGYWWCETCAPKAKVKVNWGLYSRVSALISSGGHRWQGVRIDLMPEAEAEAEAEAKAEAGEMELTA